MCEHIDPISLEEIPDEYLVVEVANGVEQHFDVRSIHKAIRTGNYFNPLTRERWSESVIAKVGEYEKTVTVEIEIVIVADSYMSTEKFVTHPHAPLENIIGQVLLLFDLPLRLDSVQVNGRDALTVNKETVAEYGRGEAIEIMLKYEGLKDQGDKVTLGRFTLEKYK